MERRARRRPLWPGSAIWVAASATPNSSPRSRERAGQLPIEPPHSHFPLGVVSLHFFILWRSDRSDRLVFCCAARELSLNGITYVHQHLSEAAEPLSRLPRICR